MAQTAVGDLVVNLDVNSSKFNEQMEYVKRQFKQTGDAANDSALKVQQSCTRQESAAKKAAKNITSEPMNHTMPWRKDLSSQPV